MKKRNLIFIGILLLAIGFATLTTTLIINGVTTIAENETDFKIYFSGATLNKEDYTNEIISKDKKTITFETILKSKDETSTLEYEVTNGCTIYDASVKVTVKVDNTNEIEVTNTFDAEKKLSARETRKGTLEIKLKKVTLEEKRIPITVELEFNAEERDTIDTTPINEKVYSISGYFTDKEGNVIPNANVAVFSENPQFVKTDDYGYFYVGNLERGKHELYYIDKADVNKDKETIKQNAIDTASVTTTHKGDALFEGGRKITDSLIKQEDNKKFKITLVKNNGEADEEIEVTENTKYEELPTPTKSGAIFLHWKDENGKIITNNTIVTKTTTNKLYAYYGENAYRITYNLNGGNLANKVEEAKYDKDITLDTPIKTLKVFVSDNNQGSTISENEISKILTFKGWTGENLSNTALANGTSWNGSLIKTSTFKNLSNEQDKTVTLIANFEDANVTLPSVEKAGYTCVLKEENNTYQPESSIILNGNGDNREFTVECNTNTYTISYNPNGGTGNMDKTTCTYDKDCTLRKNTFARVGWIYI